MYAVKKPSRDTKKTKWKPVVQLVERQTQDIKVMSLDPDGCMFRHYANTLFHCC